MQTLQLFIGNRNYSPWSMRPWVLLQAFAIPFKEIFVRLDAELPANLTELGCPTTAPSKVPLLHDSAQNNGIWVWDSLAIAEYLAEQFPEKQLWPEDAAKRAQARSLCAEMHSGFGALRTHCGMNIEADLSKIGAKIYAENPAVQADVARLNQIFSLAEQHQEAYLFGDFSIVDAYFSATVLRLQSYGLPFTPAAQGYRDRILAHPAVAAWVAAARAEADFLPAYEPYRRAR